MCISVLCCSLLNCLITKYIKELTTESCSPGGMLMEPGGFTAEEQGLEQAMQLKKLLSLLIKIIINYHKLVMLR